MPEPVRRGLVVVNGRILMQSCSLYKGHKAAVIEQHHIVPRSWFDAAGKPVRTPMAALCPTCHMSAHAAIDGLLAGRDVTALPPRCVMLARQAIALAKQNGLTPAPTL